MLTHVIIAHVSVCNKYSTTCNAEKRFIRYEAFQNAFSFYSVGLVFMNARNYTSPNTTWCRNCNEVQNGSVVTNSE